MSLLARFNASDKGRCGLSPGSVRLGRRSDDMQVRFRRAPIGWKRRMIYWPDDTAGTFTLTYCTTNVPTLLEGKSFLYIEKVFLFPVFDFISFPVQFVAIAKLFHRQHSAAWCEASDNTP